MFLLFETIAIINGVPQHLPWHQSRLNDSFNRLFSCDSVPDLKSLIKVPATFMTGKIKCRLSYNNINHEIVYSSYAPKKIMSLKLVEGHRIDYSMKYLDRSALNELLRMKGECDEILILKNKRITDTSYTNIVFFNGERWVTPMQPLLKGTCRARLLSEGKIQEAEIKIEDLHKFRSFKLINAMMNFEEVDEIPVGQIKIL